MFSWNGTKVFLMLKKSLNLQGAETFVPSLPVHFFFSPLLIVGLLKTSLCIQNQVCKKFLNPTSETDNSGKDTNLITSNTQNIRKKNKP